MGANILSEAIAYASRAHAGQIDKSGRPYILHPLSVMMSVGPNTSLMTVAVLHDVLEDCNVTAADLLAAGFGKDVVDAVVALTKTETGPNSYHEEFLPRVMKNTMATIVKFQDMEHNLSTIRLAMLDPAHGERLFRKYGKARAMIWSTYVQACKEVYGSIL